MYKKASWPEDADWQSAEANAHGDGRSDLTAAVNVTRTSDCNSEQKGIHIYAKVFVFSAHHIYAKSIGSI